MACEYILEKKIEKIVITRPVVEVGVRGLGFLPGSLGEKMQPWVVPLLEEMNTYLSRETVNSMRASNTIEIAPLEYMRGRSFHNSFMILDEAQNCTFEQIKMFLTRIGQDSKAVINGDTDQTDLHEMENALSVCVHKLEGVRGLSICELDEDDIITPISPKDERIRSDLGLSDIPTFLFSFLINSIVFNVSFVASGWKVIMTAPAYAK